MSEIKRVMITAVINPGFSDAVMKAAKSAGAKGGTIIHARGVSDEESINQWGLGLQEEKEIVMNDPQLRAIIEKLAEGTGLSPEEYYDQFDVMLKEYPEIFDELLNKGLDDQRRKLMDNGPLE
jgi:hypothetical protein